MRDVIKKQIKIDQKKMMLYHILSKYIRDEENMVCYTSIISIYNEIIKALHSLELKEEQRVENRLLNDYDTYNQLNDEFAEYVIPLFSPYSMCLLNNLPETDLEIVANILDKNNNYFTKEHIFEKIKDCLLSIYSQEEIKEYINKIEENNIDNVSIDQAINLIKKKRREITNKDLDYKSIELIAMYFDYLNKE